MSLFSHKKFYVFHVTKPLFCVIISGFVILSLVSHFVLCLACLMSICQSPDTCMSLFMLFAMPFGLPILNKTLNCICICPKTQFITTAACLQKLLNVMPLLCSSTELRVKFKSLVHLCMKHHMCFNHPGSGPQGANLGNLRSEHLFEVRSHSLSSSAWTSILCDTSQCFL